MRFRAIHSYTPITENKLNVAQEFKTIETFEKQPQEKYSPGIIFSLELVSFETLKQGAFFKPSPCDMALISSQPFKTFSHFQAYLINLPVFTLHCGNSLLIDCPIKNTFSFSIIYQNKTAKIYTKFVAGTF
jgi:hypothetical protein